MIKVCLEVKTKTKEMHENFIKNNLLYPFLTKILQRSFAAHLSFFCLHLGFNMCRQVGCQEVPAEPIELRFDFRSRQETED